MRPCFHHLLIATGQNRALLTKKYQKSLIIMIWKEKVCILVIQLGLIRWRSHVTCELGVEILFIKIAVFGDPVRSQKIRVIGH